MTPELKKAVFGAITDIAPEVNPDALDPHARLREQVDLDSMDWLNVVIKLRERTGVAIPERDYRRLETLDALLAYVDAHAA